MDDNSSTVKSLSALGCSFDSYESAVFEGLVDSDLETGDELAVIRIKFKIIEKLLLQEKPAQAIQLLGEVLNSLNDLSECDTYPLWEKLYLYFSKAYEQAEDWKSVAHCLAMAIESVERRLPHIIAESSNSCANETKELLAELCKRYAITLESLNDGNAKAVAAAWIKVEKAFEDCDSSRNACFSALRAVRWYITAADLDSALSALSIALDMIKLVEEMSDRGILYNELGIAFLAFELRDDSIACFRSSLKNLPEGDSDARASILQNLGSAYIAAKKFTKAIAALKQSVAVYGVMDNRAGQAQAHCNLGYALMRVGRHKLSHWHYTLARDLAKDTAWETVQIQAEGALNVLETPNFPRSAINSSPTISICPSMARLQCEGGSKTPSLSSSPSVKAKRKEKKGQRRVGEDKEKQKTKQLTTTLHTSSSFTKSSHSEDDIYLPTRQTLSLCKKNDAKSAANGSSPGMIAPVGDTRISLKTSSTYLKKTAPSDRKQVRGVMVNRKKYTRIADVSSLKPLGNPNSHGDEGNSLEEVVLKSVRTETLNRLRRTPFIVPLK
ncbi:hypothetical protein TcWFU_008429 [Taenia crassiceps]|uniref:Uncharacterized protein n=1 Tax=Taenia crassiceps TaxID=6207 RepID=A0ABR4Q4K8_9CEST